MRRLRTVLAGVALLLTGLAAPASAGGCLIFLFIIDCRDSPPPAPPPPGRLYLVADRNAQTSYTFSKPVRIGVLQITGGGTYRGFYLQPATAAADRGFGALDPIAATRQYGVNRLYLGDLYAGSEAITIPAGRYTVHVIGDRRTTVMIESRDLPGTRTVTARTPDAVTAHVDDLRAPVASADLPRRGGWFGSRPLPVAKTAYTVVAVNLVHRGPRAAASYELDACLRTDSLPLCLDGGREGAPRDWHASDFRSCDCLNDEIGTVTYEDGHATLFEPGELPAATYTANTAARTLDEVVELRSFLFTLGL